MARHFGVKPNELANRMIAAGFLALEREAQRVERLVAGVGFELEARSS
jgi:hypothetical protein